MISHKPASVWKMEFTYPHLRNSTALSSVWYVRVHEETAGVLRPHYSLTGMVCINIVITRDNGSRMHYSFYSFDSALLQLSCDIILLDDDGISNPIYMCYGAVTKRLGPDGKLFSILYSS